MTSLACGPSLTAPFAQASFMSSVRLPMLYMVQKSQSHIGSHSLSISPSQQASQEGLDCCRMDTSHLGMHLWNRCCLKTEAIIPIHKERSHPQAPGLAMATPHLPWSSQGRLQAQDQSLLAWDCSVCLCSHSASSTAALIISWI